MMSKLSLKSLFNKKQVKADSDFMQEQLVNDAERVFDILISSMNVSSMSYGELKVRFFRNVALDEKRLVDALKFLVSKRAVGWAGSSGCEVIFTRKQSFF